MRRVYDINIMKYITLFESLTGAKVKDCVFDDSLLFIVEKGQMGLAIGKQGSNLKRVENALKKPIKVTEFDDNVLQFIKNYAYPLRMFEVEQDGKNIVIKGKDTKTKGLLIGRDRANIKKMLDIVKRFFDVDEISVV